MWKGDLLKHASIQTQQWTDVHVGKTAQHVAGGNENISLNLALLRVLRKRVHKKFQSEYRRLSRRGWWRMILNFSPDSTPAGWKSHPKRLSPRIPKKKNELTHHTWNLPEGWWKRAASTFTCEQLHPLFFLSHSGGKHYPPIWGRDVPVTG